MATPPIDAPVLYEIESDQITFAPPKFGKSRKCKIGDIIKKRDKIEIDSDSKNDRCTRLYSYKLVMEGVEKVHWETSDDDEEGNTNAASYVDDFKKNYGKNAKVDAYQLFTLANGDKKKIRFEMSNPRYNKRNDVLTYDITPKSKKQLAKITGLEGETLAAGNLYSTESTRWRPDWMPDGERRNLRFAGLKNADLRNANLRWATMIDSDLREADLSGADLTAATPFRARLDKANLSGSILNSTDFGEAVLNQADLSEVIGNKVNLRDADLKWGVNLTKADLTSARLNNADLKWDANLSEVILAKANLSEANLTDADLTDADLSEANLYKANLKYANLRGTDLTRANLDSANLKETKWGGTICPNGNMNVGTEPCSGDQLIPLA